LLDLKRFGSMPASPHHRDSTPVNPSDSEKGGTYTAIAARHLLQALRHDLALLRDRLLALLARAGARRHLGRSGRKRHPFLTCIIGLAILTGLGVLTSAATMLWALLDLPIDEASLKARDRGIALTAADGTPLGRIGPLKLGDAPREAFPQLLVKAVLSIEDRRFYEHRGIDFSGMARAARRNYGAGATIEGGSTITQQLVKLRFLGNERTYARKLREAFLAVWLELHLSKDEILTRYLNSIYMGAGAVGVPAAARLYFDKSPSELDLAESALLAGLIKAPSRFNPLQNPSIAYERAAQVLDAMVENRAIDARAANDAKAHPATLKRPARIPASGTWFADWVAQEALGVTGNFAESTRVTTTLVPEMQRLAEKVIADALQKHADRNVSQAALVAMRPDGAVLAMVGGRDYRESQFNRAVQARRQPGSAFKLFVYMAALRNGFKPDDSIDATAPEVDGWEPENYAGREYATVTLAEAFARSINTAAVRLALRVGLDKLITAARDLGINTPLQKVPSLALGSSEVNLLNLTAAYAAVLAGRAPVRPWGVASLASPNQARAISVGPLAGPQQPLGADLQAALIRLLQLVIERGTAREAALNGFAAGKTGTTQDNRDAWFIGFNGSLVVGVWVGNDDRSPMREVTGGTLPAEIWKDFMIKASSRTPAEGLMASSRTGEGASLEEQKPQAKCDYRACAAKYQSFNADDCTYQPYGGGRRRQCEKAATTAQIEWPEQAVSDQGQHQCNYVACAQVYSSFRREDCSYQPYEGGPRRLCQR
jgi:1A family penicillin-binding protein